MDNQEQWLQSIKKLKEAHPEWVEFHGGHGGEEGFYIVEECQGYIGCSERDADMPHDVYTVYPFWPGVCFLHRFENEGESYSGLYLGNHRELLVCKRGDELHMLDFFYDHQDETAVFEARRTGNLGDDLWRPEL